MACLWKDEIRRIALINAVSDVFLLFAMVIVSGAS